jgi:PAS domain S-box-containing protein
MHLGDALDLPSLLEEVLDATMELQGADFGDVQLFDDSSGKLRIIAHRNLGPDFLEHFAVVDASDSSAGGGALKHGERVLINDVTTDPDYTPHREIAAATGYRGVLSTPLFERSSNKPLGMLSTLFREPLRPTERELRLTDLFARHAADLISSRLVEERLRDSEEYFRLALAAGNMGTWEWDANTHRIKANETHQALFGLPPQTKPLPNEVYWERMEPGDSSLGTKRAMEALESGDDVRLELPIWPSEGTKRWISIQGRPRHDGTTSLIGISRDITERKNREHALREHQEWLAAILDQVPGGVGLFDQDGRLVLRGGPLGNLWDDTLPSLNPDSMNRWRSFDERGHLLSPQDYPGARALRGETSTRDSLRTADDGRECWFRISASPFRSQDGEIAGATVFIQDVDKERRAQERLRESEARLKNAVELVRLGLYSIEVADGKSELHWDDVVRSMWGLPPGSAVTYETWEHGIHPDDREFVQEAVDQAYDPAGTGIYDIEYRVIGQDGVERWIATRGQSQFEHGRATSFLGVVLDITDRKVAERKLEHLVELRTSELGRANANLQTETKERRLVDERLDLVQTELFHASRLSVAGQMAAMIAHEISQPLAAVVNSVAAIRRLLASRAPGAAASVRELAEDIAAQADRAHEILRRLRRFIRRESPDRLPEPIKPLVEEAVAFAMTGPEALGVTISCYFDPLVETVLVDRVQIQQVIANLVRNSLQSMGETPRKEINVATRARDDQMLEISVTDSGSEVPDHFREKLFEPFQSTKPGGMGLGLSICRTILETQGGRIGYEPAFGGGSTFSFVIPVAADTAK